MNQSVNCSKLNEVYRKIEAPDFAISRKYNTKVSNFNEFEAPLDKKQTL